VLSVSAREAETAKCGSWRPRGEECNVEPRMVLEAAMRSWRRALRNDYECARAALACQAVTRISGIASHDPSVPYHWCPCKPGRHGWGSTLQQPAVTSLFFARTGMMRWGPGIPDSGPLDAPSTENSFIGSGGKGATRGVAVDGWIALVETLIRCFLNTRCFFW
jgi:hypothetical protein